MELITCNSKSLQDFTNNINSDKQGDLDDRIMYTYIIIMEHARSRYSAFDDKQNAHESLFLKFSATVGVAFDSTDI